MRKVFLFLFAIFLIGIICAQPAFLQPNSLSSGYAIKIQEIGTLKQNTDFTFNFHVFNISNGVPISNSSTSCYFHLYTANGTQILETSPVSTSDTSNVNNEWMLNVLGGNFSQLGDYAYTIQCNSTAAGLGGFASVGFDVTLSGGEQSTAQGVAALGYLVLMIFLTLFFGFVGFRLADSENLWILGMFFIFLALVLVTYDTWLGVLYYENFMGTGITSSVPQTIFYIYLGLLVLGLIVSAILLFKKIPQIIEWFKVKVLGEGNEDGWDGGKLE